MFMLAVEMGSSIGGGECKEESGGWVVTEGITRRSAKRRQAVQPGQQLLLPAQQINKFQTLRLVDPKPRPIP